MRISLPACLAALVAAALTATSAQAQNAKSFVASSAGASDGNTCATEATPCRTMGGALAKTNSGGIIYCLDHGEFSGDATTTITKSITIDCAGTGASLRLINTGIVINATAADTVHIRGLKIKSSRSQIIINSTAAAAAVRVEACDLIGNPEFTAIVLSGDSSSNLMEMLVVNTTISNASAGIALSPVGAARVTLDNVRIFNSTVVGLGAVGTNATTAPGLRVMVKNSTITGSGIWGILAQSTNGTTRVFVEDSVIAHNDAGIQADGARAAIFVSGTTITQNAHGLSAINGGQLFTYGNNKTQGNVQTNGVFTSPVALQ